MGDTGLVFGLLDVAGAIGDPDVAEKYRGLTIDWSRYGYRGPIVEAASLDEILDRASATDHRYCFVQSYGHIIRESWDPTHSDDPDFLTALQAWAAEHDFLVCGRLCHRDDGWWGVDRTCLLIDLGRYRNLGRPRAEPARDTGAELPKVKVLREDGRIAALEAASGTEFVTPSMPAWNLLATSLAQGLAIHGLPAPIDRHTLSLEPEVPRRTRAFANLLGSRLSESGLEAEPDLADGQREFLRVVQRQVADARGGVFLWNIESYADVEQPPREWSGPISSLYSVAAGFKPNRILESHGFSRDTKIAFFDYSERALEIRSEIVENWDGSDFPDFVRHLFSKYPHPETFYQLWSDLTPDTVGDGDLEQMWQSELGRWGGGEKFAEHWQAYSRLEHEYILCHLLAEPEPLLDRIADEDDAVMWFSNAFFTMHSNWQYTIDERRDLYESWVARIVSANPRLLLYGSDYNNINVNCLHAGDYWTSYQESGYDYLSPTKFHRHELRM